MDVYSTPVALHHGSHTNHSSFPDQSSPRQTLEVFVVHHSPVQHHHYPHASDCLVDPCYRSLPPIHQEHMARLLYRRHRHCYTTSCPCLFPNRCSTSNGPCFYPNRCSRSNGPCLYPICYSIGLIFPCRKTFCFVCTFSIGDFVGFR